jgi:hypothetical protein
MRNMVGGGGRGRRRKGGSSWTTILPRDFCNERAPWCFRSDIRIEYFRNCRVESRVSTERVSSGEFALSQFSSTFNRVLRPFYFSRAVLLHFIPICTCARLAHFERQIVALITRWWLAWKDRSRLFGDVRKWLSIWCSQEHVTRNLVVLSRGICNARNKNCCQIRYQQATRQSGYSR